MTLHLFAVPVFTLNFLYVAFPRFMLHILYPDFACSFLFLGNKRDLVDPAHF